MLRRFLLVVALLGLTGCSLGRHEASIPKGAAVVTIEQMAFRPPVVEVRVGQPVVWRFDDQGVVHDVAGLTAPPRAAGSLRSPDLESGIWTHRFAVPGIYLYRCALHPYMRAEVIVVP